MGMVESSLVFVNGFMAYSGSCIQVLHFVERLFIALVISFALRDTVVNLSQNWGTSANTWLGWAGLA